VAKGQHQRQTAPPPDNTAPWGRRPAVECTRLLTDKGGAEAGAASQEKSEQVIDRKPIACRSWSTPKPRRFHKSACERCGTEPAHRALPRRGDGKRRGQSIKPGAGRRPSRINGKTCSRTRRQWSERGLERKVEGTLQPPRLKAMTRRLLIKVCRIKSREWCGAFVYAGIQTREGGRAFLGRPDGRRSLSNLYDRASGAVRTLRHEP